jgi:microcystin-dependent protein
MIYETDTFSYRWYTGSVWVGVTPSGTTQSFAGSTEPPGWLFCFGQSLNGTTSPEYADLFAAIGTTYGGSGVTAFSLPDLRGRTPFGKDNMGGTAASRVTNAASSITGTTLGANGGAQTHTLTVAQLAAHGHSGSITTSAIGESAGMYHRWNAGDLGRGDSTGSNGQFGISVGNNGSNQAHQNMPPTIILNYIIKI